MNLHSLNVLQKAFNCFYYTNFGNFRKNLFGLPVKFINEDILNKIS